MRLDAVSENYDRASKYYDPLTTVVFGWILRLEKYREQVVELLGDIEGQTVLVIGCGTGRTLPLLVSAVGESGRVIGVDYSEGMLDKASERVRDEGWSNVELRRDDASTLATIEEPVDAAVSIWCLGIVQEFDDALRRATEVVRPGGRLAIMDFAASRPEEGALHWLFPLYSRVLQWAGIDSAEDMDNERLKARWERGQAYLKDTLTDWHEEHYLGGPGIILAGTMPNLDQPE